MESAIVVLPLSGARPRMTMPIPDDTIIPAMTVPVPEEWPIPPPVGTAYVQCQDEFGVAQAWEVNAGGNLDTRDELGVLHDLTVTAGQVVVQDETGAPSFLQLVVP